ncbi:InlB B-repeat-containing protein [Eubacteriales bacterium KG127]
MKKFLVFIVALVMIFNLGLGSISTIYAQDTSEGNSGAIMPNSNSDDVSGMNDEYSADYNNEWGNLTKVDSSSSDDEDAKLVSPDNGLEKDKPKEFVRTYKFIVEGDKTPVNIQSLTKSDNDLYEPPTPRKKGYTFDGWFMNGKKLEFPGDIKPGKTQILDWENLNKNEEVTVVAKFSDKKKHEVTFFIKKELDKDEWSSIDERLLSTGDTISLKEILVPLKADEHFLGWYKDKNLQEAVNEDAISVSDQDNDIKLYAKIEKGAYLSFNVGLYSKSYIEPKFIKPGDITSDPNAKPDRFEHTFQYWTEGPTDKQDRPEFMDWGDFYEKDYVVGPNEDAESKYPKYEFGNKLDKNKKLYAVWKENPTISYKINIFKQKESDSFDKLNDRNYEINDVKNATIDNNSDKDKLVESIKKNFFEEYNTKYTYGGFHIAANTENSNYESENRKHKFEGVFKFDKSDGFHPAEFNVYYNRDLIEINFHNENNVLEYKFLGLYLQKLLKTLPKEKKWPSESYKESTGNERRITFLDSFKLDGLYGVSKLYDESSRQYKQSIVLKKDVSKIAQRKITQMLETLEDGIYKEDVVAETPNSIFSVTDKYTGFHPYQYQIDDDKNERKDLALDNNGKLIKDDVKNTIEFKNFIKIFNKRNKYKITFENVDKTETKEQTYKYEEPLKNLKSLEPQRPSDINDNYEFSGWYMDKDFEEKINLDTFTMPSHDIVLYAKWEPKNVNIRVFKVLDAIHTNKELNIPKSLDSIVELNLSFDYNSDFTSNKLPKVTKNEQVIEQGSPYKDKNGNFKPIDIPSDHIWSGWYYAKKDSKELKPFNTHLKLKEDYDLYAFSYTDITAKAFYYTDYNEWVKKIRGAIFVSHEHNKDTMAVISEPDFDKLDVIDKKFVAWSDGTRRYNKGDSFVISKDLYLYPIFSEDKPINLTVIKEWKNKYGEKIKAPVKSIKAALYVDSVKNKEVELNSGNNWSYTFKNLPEKSISTGEKYNYEIKEVGETNGKIALSGIKYDVKVKGDVKSGFTITNIKSIEIIPAIKLEKPIKKVPLDSTSEKIPGFKLGKPDIRGVANKYNINVHPNTGDSLRLEIYLILAGIAISGVYMLLRKRYNFK